jgi:integrase
VAHVRSSLETPTARCKLAIRKKPYKVRIARGIKLLYRRNEGVGTWSVEASDGHGKSWTRKFADTNDHDEADGSSILDFWSAQDKAKALARGKTSEGEGAPVTVSQAVDDYETELKNHGADPANAKRVRSHLSATLAGKCVALLSVRDLRAFRDGLTGKGLAPGGVNRTMKPLSAALNAAAAADPRITNNAAWRIGLAGLPVGDTARRIVLPDVDVGRIVTAAYEIDRPFGVYVEVSAVTGPRPSQAARLTVADLQADRADPRLMMPTSRKGGRRAAGKKIPHKPVPIPAGLAALLLDASKGRPADAPLLVRGDGAAWDGAEHQRLLFRQAVTRAGLDPDTITPYALRHSSIVRMLLRNAPVRVVASLHDTSVAMIEKHYSAFISDFADSIARGAMLDLSAPAPDNVVPFSKG